MIRKNYVVVEGGGLSLWDSGLDARAPVRNRSRLSDGDRPCSRALPIADSFPAVAKLRSNNGVKAGVERPPAAAVFKNRTAASLLLFRLDEVAPPFKKIAFHAEFSPTRSCDIIDCGDANFGRKSRPICLLPMSSRLGLGIWPWPVREPFDCSSHPSML